MDEQQRTILIVDDTPANLSVLHDHLIEAGFRVLVDVSGRSALDKIHATKPDLILLDIMMPDMDGYETCTLLKSNRETSNIPVIFMTALTDPLDEVKAFEVGALDYITKPVKVLTVEARVRNHLHLHFLKEELRQNNIELDAFSHTVAHDLRAPLSTIQTYADYLMTQNQELDADHLQKMLSNVYRSSFNASNMIDELLLLKGLRTKQVKSRKVDMERAVRKAQDRLKLAIIEHNATIEPPAEWIPVSGYAPWVEEVLVNLLYMAMQFSVEEDPVIRLNSENNLSRVEYTIVEERGGIHLSEEERNLTAYAELQTIRPTGHGLGLPVVQKILQHLQGNLEVEASADGSYFFRLSMQTVD
jgi:DNA-binding response OmpR family regulator